MNELYTLASALEKEESRNVTIFLNRTNASSERKDQLLFNEIRKNPLSIDEEKLILQMYGKNNKNAFYRLKNRLLTEINKCLLHLYYDHVDFNYILNQIILARHIRQKHQYELCFKYLKKAERKALKNDDSSLLDIIYNEFIVLSQEAALFNPVSYIEKRKNNRLKLNKLQEIDDILAVLTYRLKTSQNYAKNANKLTQLLQSTINDYSEDNKQSKQLRFKIYHAISKIFLQESNYTALEAYLLETYHDFNQESLFDKNNHDTKLKMLTYLINSLYFNKKHEQSIEYAETLKKEMLSYNELLYNKYEIYYYNALVINYQVVDKRKAANILLEAKEKKGIQQLPSYHIFVYLNLAIIFFDLAEYKKTRKNISLSRRHKNYEQTDNSLLLKVHLLDLMAIYELNDYDLFEYEFKQIQKSFKELFGSGNFQRENKFITLLANMHESMSLKKDKELQSKAQEFITSFPNTSKDILDLNEWLQKKFKFK